VCFPDGSRPPSFPGKPVDVGCARTVLRPVSSSPFAVVSCVPIRASSRAALVVLPDGRGLGPYYSEFARRIGQTGREALAVDLYGRTAGVGPRRPGFVSAEHSARLTWAGVQQDLSAAVEHLRRDDRTRPVFAVGFCLGGRVSLLAASRTELRLSGAVAFYPQTHGPARSDLPAPDELVSEFGCPVLSLFGGSDELIPAADVQRWRTALAGTDQASRVIVYPGAPHSFFDRSTSRFASESADAARRLLEFVTLLEPT
jgi:carboxymethylenebutenolidase